MKTLFKISSLVAFVSAAAVSCGAPSISSHSRPDDFTRYQLYGDDLPYKNISLTFDDGPGGRTLELARYLADRNIPATFFVVGNAARGNEGVLRELKSLGHLVANHSDAHEAMTRVGDPIEAVRATDRVIAPYTTGNMFLFRAPYGDWSARVADILNANGLRKYVGSIFWDIGGDLTSRYSADWDCWGRGLTVADCGQGYINETMDKGSGIVLLHDVHSKTVDMVKWMVPRLENSGYKFVRIDAVPNIADQIRNAGGTPGSDSGSSEPQVLGEMECSTNYELVSVGSSGGKICVSGNRAEGPFTVAMRSKCVSWGGGQTCQSNVWDKSFALKIRGNGICQDGSSYDAATQYCLEGSEALGPFPSRLRQSCLNSGNSAADCNSNRWDRSVLIGLLQ